MQAEGMGDRAVNLVVIFFWGGGVGYGPRQGATGHRREGNKGEASLGWQGVGRST